MCERCDNVYCDGSQCDWTLICMALGIDQPATLLDATTAEIARMHYDAAMLDRRMRETRHTLHGLGVQA